MPRRPLAARHGQQASAWERVDAVHSVPSNKALPVNASSFDMPLGFFVVSYALGVFLLSQFLGFLTPQVQPSLSSDADPLLPTNSDGEFRPFMRRVSEIKFWKGCTFAVALSIICTFFPFLDLPVFWPVLLLYFIILCYVTLQRQIAHMIKYRYMPFTYGKPRPQAKGGSDTATTIFAADEYIQEGQLAVFFFLHRKLNVQEDGVEMFFECQHLIPFDFDEGVIRIPSPEFRHDIEVIVGPEFLKCIALDLGKHVARPMRNEEGGHWVSDEVFVSSVAPVWLRIDSTAAIMLAGLASAVLNEAPCPNTYICSSVSFFDDKFARCQIF
nr:unnamed protein product [Spirometra erinaceieuropaei]